MSLHRWLRLRLIALTGSMLVFVLVSTACQNWSSGAPLRIGLNIWPGYGAFFIADSKGFYKEEQVVVKLEIIQGDAEREQALVAGRLDGIGMTIDNLVRLRGKGLKLKAIYKYDDSYGADGLIAVKDITTVPELKGRSVAYALGTPSHFFLTQILGEYGLTTKDVKSVAMSPDDAGTAFVSGKLDAAVTWEPWLSKAKAQPNGRILVTTREKPVIQDVLFVAETVIEKRRRDLVKFLRACFRAVDFWKRNPAEGNRIVAKALNLPASDVDEMLQGIRIMDLSMNEAFFGTPATRGPAYESYDNAVSAWLKEGVISRPQDAADGIDSKLIAEVSR